MTILSGDNIHYSANLGNLNRRTHRGRVVVGWFPDNARTTMQMLIDRYDVKTVIEIGSFVGLSACFFAERVDTVTCVDRFDRNVSRFATDVMGLEPADQHTLFKQNTAAYPNITSIKADSLQAAEQADLVADLVFIDAGHEYEEVKADVEAWRPHATKVICGDDNQPNWPSVQKYAREIGADTTERVWWLPIG
jgi:predicted O-methyltransferase YrrM